MSEEVELYEPTTLRLRATTVVRNDFIMAELERRGWSQSDLARAANVEPTEVSCLCRLKYSSKHVRESSIFKISATLGLTIEQIRPEAMRGIDLNTKHVSIAEVTTDALLGLAEGCDELLEIDQRDEVRQLIQGTKLTNRERAVVIKRYGLNGGQPMTLDSTGHDMKCTRERIRQIELKAIRKIRSSPSARRIFSEDYSCQKRVDEDE